MTMKTSMTTLRWMLAFGLASVLILLVAGAANAQPPVPHPVEKGGTSFEDCLGCHTTGMGDGPVLPADHEPYDNETCGVCHRVAGIAPPLMPHPEETEGTPFEDCAACHGAGVGDAPIMPTDHQELDNEDCEICHTAGVVAGPPIPHPEEREGTPFEDCVFCHRAGLVGAPLLPADHQARDNQDCSLCHSTAGLAPPSISHVSERSCADCHRTGAYGAALLPDDHQAHSDEDCLVCHSTAALAAPNIPAVGGGQRDCLSCHHDAAPETVPALENAEHDHSVYTGDTCLSCHRPSAETGVIEVSTEETEETPHDVPAYELRVVSADVQEDADGAWRDAVTSRWAIIIAVSGVFMITVLLLRRP